MIKIIFFCNWNQCINNKKMVQNAEDFIAEIHQGVKITKAVLAVPAHFDNN